MSGRFYILLSALLLIGAGLLYWGGPSRSVEGERAGSGPSNPSSRGEQAAVRQSAERFGSGEAVSAPEEEQANSPRYFSNPIPHKTRSQKANNHSSVVSNQGVSEPVATVSQPNPVSPVSAEEPISEDQQDNNQDNNKGQDQNTSQEELTDSINQAALFQKTAEQVKRKLTQRENKDQVGTQFIKVDFDGNELPDDAAQWSCARDIRTGLLWETKLNDAGVSDVEHKYSWYDPNREEQGVAGKGHCFGVQCDTFSYTEEMNRLALCGSTHWHVPSFLELESIIDRDFYDPVINRKYFPNAIRAAYWTATPVETNPKMIMQIDFFNGTSSPAPITYLRALRLVSD